MEHRHEAVREVLEGHISVVAVAARYGVARQTVHRWVRRFADGGSAALVERSKRPHSCPQQIPGATEVQICELRRRFPEWGPARLRHELSRGGDAAPSRATIYRVLVRNRLIIPKPKRSRPQRYIRWERRRPMELWQVDVMGRVKLQDGSKLYVVTSVDDHSRFCVIARLVERPTARAVCSAFLDALRRYGIPDEVLTDNGKVFTGRFAPARGEVLFERICRENGIRAIHTSVRSPTTTGKIERFHRTLRQELFDRQALRSMDEAQAALDKFVETYNAFRPHQALGMQTPAERFRSGVLQQETPSLKDPEENVADEDVEPIESNVGPYKQVMRKVWATGQISVAGADYPVGRALAGRHVVVRVGHDVVRIFQAGTLLRVFARRHSAEREAGLQNHRRPFKKRAGG